MMHEATAQKDKGLQPMQVAQLGDPSWQVGDGTQGDVQLLKA